MKIQDILFIIILIILIFKRDERWLVVAGVLSLSIAIPLFSLWVFFTAERLTWYSAGFFIFAIFFSIIDFKKKT